jgi:hypothetical protein
MIDLLLLMGKIPLSHMGLTAVDGSRGDLDKIIQGLQETIREAKAAKGIQ